ncbi:broad-specificity cellobiase [Saccharopolyspora erythraea NRRL 2338]|uniref:Beta-glucosidase n=2 Tax=Saccharopolyspora erythraea TaxID=1836 RepID=A4FKW1_SACEN|nr:GH1 family beta-glucosidase [Saccharopolyspora erythraea]EQD85673.1 beta-glucosidase [Saccharopolyspora erythraea D]PFG98326.1 broad-specificity cellobiase [Saccharopolyspora erythraea NRRL 2338]QRK88406.1 beta-glucosidase [Saccharopolyspora erythraea]CAM04686.1 beta-glucosidase [Saccharopolyspora erythraea NRRL 2338]
MTNQKALEFPPGFVWGAATASYQVEGGVKEDGRGPSIWDTFCALEGKVLNGDTGEVACDHFHRYAEDVGLMAELGLPAYRFSVSWPRVMPDGRTVHPPGVGFYDRLVDELLDQGISPIVTLYHWDLPQALEDEGGWRVRDTAARFADYAAVMHGALGDRVQDWMTLNEPFCAAFLGYGSGVHAPGVADHGTALVAAHHQLLAHGLGMAALRSAAAPGQRFSLALNFSPVLVDVDDEAHREAARKFDGMHNRMFLDPVLGRGYPADVLADVAHLNALEPAILGGDLETIGTGLDWLGVNYYAPTRVTPLADPAVPSNCGLPGLRGFDVLPPRGPLTSFGWEQAPSSLTDLLLWLHRHCPEIPLVVAENGAAFPDTIDSDGRVRDHDRALYFAEHLRAVHSAIRQGAGVRGYLAWSLLDNFEWAMGYTQRFGLVHVDFETQQRTIKDSGRFYSRILANNAVPADDSAELTTS